MKVRVSGMAWLPREELGASGIAYLKKALTIVPKRYSAYGDDKPRPIKCYREDGPWLGVPRAYFFKTSQKDHEVEWDYTAGEPLGGFECLLRQEGKYAEQATAIDKMLAHMKGGANVTEKGLGLGGILQGATGFGKTNTALALAHKLGRKTLIVVHKEFLLRQWVRRIEKFMPDAKVGIVQESTCDFEGDFTIAMVQSLALEEKTDEQRYPKEFYSHHGLIFIDETHRIGAASWAPVPSLFQAQYIVGLTATPRRKDGADKVFWWSIGDVVYKAKTETPKPLVRMIESDARGPDFMTHDTASPPVIINVLTKLTQRNQLAVNEAIKALRSPAGRKVMVISERLEQLRTLSEMILDQGQGIEHLTVGFYVGEWFTGEMTLSLKRVRDLEPEVRQQAIETIYRHFRRQKAGKDAAKERKAEDDTLLAKGPPKPKATALWKGKCGRRGISYHQDENGNDVYTETHEILLYRHGHAHRALESLSSKQLCSLARDYDIAQDKPKPVKKALTEEQLHEAEKARVVFATYQMCAEGVDIPAIDTQVLASPVSDVEQAAGRARRFCIPKAFGGDKSPEDCEHLCAWRAGSCEGKPEPIIADIVDRRFPLTEKRKRYRLSFYRDLGTKVAGATG